MLERRQEDERELLVGATESFARGLSQDLAGRRTPGELDRIALRRCGEFGLQGLPLPALFGGTAQSAETIALAMMAFGRGCRDNGFTFSLGAHLWAFQMPILRFGTEAQKDRYLRPACAGELLGAHAVTEPDSGSDAMSMRSRAERRGTGWVLNGTKTFITNAPSADAVIVFATVNPAMKSAGITGFIVERGTPGLTLSRAIPKSGLESSPMGEVILEDCFVPDEQRIGSVGTGSAIFSYAMELERLFLFAAHLGGMERLLSDCVAYARTRVQFGVPIAQHPEIASKLVDMQVDVEAGRALILHAAHERDAGRPSALFSAIAKLFVSEAHVRQALAAIQLHGGYGVSSEGGIERELRDAVPGTIYSGTSEMQRKVIARWMGLS